MFTVGVRTVWTLFYDHLNLLPERKLTSCSQMLVVSTWFFSSWNRKRRKAINASVTMNGPSERLGLLSTGTVAETRIERASWCEEDKPTKWLWRCWRKSYLLMMSFFGLWGGDPHLTLGQLNELVKWGEGELAPSSLRWVKWTHPGPAFRCLSVLFTGEGNWQQVWCGARCDINAAPLRCAGEKLMRSCRFTTCATSSE